MTDRVRKNTGIRRLIVACGSTTRGIKYIFSNEAAFRQEILACFVLVPASFFVASDLRLALTLITSMLIVLIVEVLNTAIEVTIDRISLDQHPLSGAAKELGSFAVVLALINSLVWWGYAIYLLISGG
ncbi:diacylglycerol kinase [Pseudophaeobacter sp.]|uniref:diacylglycerol kinase n=1 Tax=Pseudophaeobacter sp. TaxID=1971739 RepID=UPI00329684C8